MSDEQRYDRQLRLWQSTGQGLLELSKVCLVNATSTGCEVLKNLVLPNVGGFTIIDGAKVAAEDLSANFFLEESDVGELRASAATRVLLELNVSVEGRSVDQSLDQVIGHIDWSEFSLVILSGRIGKCGDELVDRLWLLGVPVVVVDSVGFYGCVKIVVRELSIIESHSTEKLDLRVDCPWEELADYVFSLAIDSLALEQYKDIPYSVLLVHYVSQLRQGDVLPKRQPLKDYIRKQTRKYAAGNLENVEELLANSWRGTVHTKIPEEVLAIVALSDGKASTSHFWVLTKALKCFIDETGRLPLSGRVADMASSTEQFIRLQNMYKAKADSDKEKLRQYAEKINDSGTAISEAYLSSFAKNVNYIVVQQGSKQFMNHEVAQDADAAAYVALQAVEAYFTRHGVFPVAVEELLKYAAAATEDVRNVLQELIRSGGHELISIAALVGGIGGQECLKLLTNQYVPLNNTLVFDGIASKIHRWDIKDTE